jgi:hypothetical protein
MVETTINRNESGLDTGKDSDNGAIGPIDKPTGGNTEPAAIGGFATISPAELRTPDTGDATGKRRGRPRGSKNRTQEDKPQGNLIESVESLLLSVHFMAAKLLEIEELELDADEAKRLSNALKKVAEFYPVAISPKRLALAELAIAAGTVYGPRAVALYKKPPKKPGPVRVIQPPAPPGHSSSGTAVQPPQRPAAGPRVPSEMWTQDGNEVAGDQA